MYDSTVTPRKLQSWEFPVSLGQTFEKNSLSHLHGSFVSIFLTTCRSHSCLMAEPRLEPELLTLT